MEEKVREISSAAKSIVTATSEDAGNVVRLVEKVTQQLGQNKVNTQTLVQLGDTADSWRNRTVMFRKQLKRSYRRQVTAAAKEMRKRALRLHACELVLRRLNDGVDTQTPDLRDAAKHFEERLQKAAKKLGSALTEFHSPNIAPPEKVLKSAQFKRGPINAPTDLWCSEVKALKRLTKQPRGKDFKRIESSAKFLQHLVETYPESFASPDALRKRLGQLHGASVSAWNRHLVFSNLLKYAGKLDRQKRKAAAQLLGIVTKSKDECRSARGTFAEHWDKEFGVAFLSDLRKGIVTK